MTAAIARDPRIGLKPSLDLLSAYELYEKDYPVYYPDNTATLAMDSPLYKKIEEGLTEQTNIKLENQSDATQTQRIASTAGDSTTTTSRSTCSALAVPGRSQRELGAVRPGNLCCRRSLCRTEGLHSKYVNPSS